MAAMPVFMLIQHLDERNKRKAERLEEETNVLRLEVERERLLNERDDALEARKRRKMLDAGYVLCPRCREWCDELGEDGICDPCEIDQEIDSAIT